MNSKNLKPAEKDHLQMIKEMPCSVCKASPPSDAHHIKQGLHYLCIPLCKDCHQGSFNGIHGQARIWSVYKMDELTALNNTIRAMTERPS